MSSRLLVIALSSLLLLSASACHHRGSARAVKPSKTPAAELEVEYHKLFVGKRVNELTASGMSPADASAKAEKEYEDTYRYAITNPNGTTKKNF